MPATAPTPPTPAASHLQTAGGCSREPRTRTPPRSDEAAASSSGRQRWTELSEHSAAAAILHVLQLDGESVRVCEIELRCATFGAATIGHAQRDVGDERRAGLAALLLQPVADQQLRDRRRVEALHGDAAMVDRRRCGPTASRTSAGSGTAPGWSTRSTGSAWGTGRPAAARSTATGRTTTAGRAAGTCGAPAADE